MALFSVGTYRVTLHALPTALGVGANPIVFSMLVEPHSLTQLCMYK